MKFNGVSSTIFKKELRLNGKVFMIIYTSKILGMGDNAADFKVDHTFITFAKDIPETLEKYCYYIELSKLEKDISVGDTLQIDKNRYKITAVGSAASENLRTHGHVCFKFNGKKQEEMPGVIHLEAGKFPELNVGSDITIFSEDFYGNTTQMLESDLILRESYTDFIHKNLNKVKTTKLSVYLREIVFQTCENIAEAFKDSPLSASYVYQILNGDRIPSRDKLIILAFILEMNLHQLNRALKYAEKSELYVKNQRDSVIMHGIIHKKSLESVNKKLSETNLNRLK